ncbi:hypothetical protein [Roseibium sp.]|uniref:hypothetical protein n=1 Tax=Roseibium sp. TaxID=1936156 RepID=UPI00328DF84C
MPTEKDFVAEGLTEDELASLESDVEAQGDTPEPEPREPDAGNEPEGGEPEAQAEPSKPQEEPKTVDLRALQEARNENRQIREQMARMEERTNVILQQISGQRQEAKDQGEPDPFTSMPDDNDPMGQLAWLKNHVVSDAKQRQQVEQQSRQQSQWQQQVEHIVSEASREFNSEAQHDPSVGDAYNHLRQSMANQFAVIGLAGRELETAMERHEQEHILTARSRNIPIGAYIKGMAAARGWQAQAPQQQAQPGNDGQQLQRQAEAQDRHMSLSSASGGEPPKPITAKDLAGMSDKAFQEFIKKNPAKVDELMGIAS